VRIGIVSPSREHGWCRVAVWFVEFPFLAAIRGVVSVGFFACFEALFVATRFRKQDLLFAFLSPYFHHFLLFFFAVHRIPLVHYPRTHPLSRVNPRHPATRVSPERDVPEVIIPLPVVLSRILLHFHLLRRPSAVVPPVTPSQRTSQRRADLPRDKPASARARPIRARKPLRDLA
jgi:hypothetical protein